MTEKATINMKKVNKNRLNDSRQKVGDERLCQNQIVRERREQESEHERVPQSMSL